MAEVSPIIGNRERENHRPSKARLNTQLDLRSSELLGGRDTILNRSEEETLSSFFDPSGNENIQNIGRELQLSNPIEDTEAERELLNTVINTKPPELILHKGSIIKNSSELPSPNNELQLPMVVSQPSNLSEATNSQNLGNELIKEEMVKPPELNLYELTGKEELKLPMVVSQPSDLLNESGKEPKNLDVVDGGVQDKSLKEAKPKEDIKPDYQVGQASLDITRLDSVKKEGVFKKFWKDLGEFGVNAWPHTLGKFFSRQPAEVETRNVPQQTFVAAEVNSTNADWWQDKLKKEGRDSKGNILSESPVVLPKREFAVNGEVKDETKNPFADAVSIYKVDGSTISFLNSVYNEKKKLGLSKELFEEKLKESGILFSVLKRGIFSELKKELGREYTKNVPNNLLSPENIFVYAHDIFPELLIDEKSEIKKSEVTAKLQQALDSTEKPNEKDIVMEIWRKLYPDKEEDIEEAA